MTTAFEDEEEGNLLEFLGEEETNRYPGKDDESTFEVLDEEALLAELYEVTTEEELDQFLGNLARSVVRGASQFVKSPIGNAIGGMVKSVAKTALPMVGGALGSMVMPGVGTALGSKLGSMAGNLLEEEEVAAMGEIAAEEESARRYIRFARAAFRNGARAPRSVPYRPAARAAVRSAAKTYAPALLRPSPGHRSHRYPSVRTGYAQSWSSYEPADSYDDDDGGTSGRWVRRGNTVTLFGI
ncbi:hypothetical protein [Prescottella agglutinans]|uniref:hypothetical protein n=1 Tax=Prescottella agglutinans TaxID=1644129 RepID=UPI003D982A00